MDTKELKNYIESQILANQAAVFTGVNDLYLIKVSKIEAYKDILAKIEELEQKKV